jgi:hypothetical protein
MWAKLICLSYKTMTVNPVKKTEVSEEAQKKFSNSDTIPL